MRSALRAQVEAAIRDAFEGVVLGRGISLRQAQAIDRYCRGISEAEFAALPNRETTNDWTQLSLEEQERDCVAHLDAEGFRYYIPALMLGVLCQYDPSSMRVIGTIRSLYPKQDSWDYHLDRYSMLDDRQKSAIALYLEALPSLLPLDYEDQKVVVRALRNYWRDFLPAAQSPGA